MIGYGRMVDKLMKKRSILLSALVICIAGCGKSGDDVSSVVPEQNGKKPQTAKPIELAGGGGKVGQQAASAD